MAPADTPPPLVARIQIVARRRVLQDRATRRRRARSGRPRAATFPDDARLKERLHEAGPGARLDGRRVARRGTPRRYQPRPGCCRSARRGAPADDRTPLRRDRKRRNAGLPRFSRLQRAEDAAGSRRLRVRRCAPRRERRVQRHRHVDRPPRLGLEEAPMVVVVVVAQEEEPLVEIADAFEVGFPQHPRSARHGVASVDPPFERLDDFRRLDQPAAQSDALVGAAARAACGRRAAQARRNCGRSGPRRRTGRDGRASARRSERIEPGSRIWMSLCSSTMIGVSASVKPRLSQAVSKIGTGLRMIVARATSGQRAAFEDGARPCGRAVLRPVVDHDPVEGQRRRLRRGGDAGVDDRLGVERRRDDRESRLDVVQHGVKHELRRLAQRGAAPVR